MKAVYSLAFHQYRIVAESILAKLYKRWKMNENKLPDLGGLFGGLLLAIPLIPEFVAWLLKRKKRRSQSPWSYYYAKSERRSNKGSWAKVQIGGFVAIMVGGLWGLYRLLGKFASAVVNGWLALIFMVIGDVRPTAKKRASNEYPDMDA